ncbi:transcription elongation factor GreA [bacterium]|nr:MAG: transcription elongation factor GreA [bacterium]
MGSEVQFTREGFEKLKAELEELKGPTRMRIAEAIREAKSHGDLKENAAYHEAKLNQTRLESRIAELDKALLTAKIVEPSTAGGAQLGAKVGLLDLEYDEDLTVKLVGAFEADPANDLISVASPLGEALIGRRVGDEIEVKTPGGMTRYRIQSVS